MKKTPSAKRKKTSPALKMGERGLPLWPRGKPLPKFRSHEEEAKWWNSYDLEQGDEASWEAVDYVPRSTHQPRSHVYRIRFDDFEMSRLQSAAKRRGVTVSVIIRELVRSRSLETERIGR